MSDSIDKRTLAQALSGLVSVCEKLDSRIENIEKSLKKVESKVEDGAFGSSFMSTSGLDNIRNDLEHVKVQIRSISQ